MSLHDEIEAETDAFLDEARRERASAWWGGEQVGDHTGRMRDVLDDIQHLDERSTAFARGVRRLSMQDRARAALVRANVARAKKELIKSQVAIAGAKKDLAKAALMVEAARQVVADVRDRVAASRDCVKETDSTLNNQETPETRGF